MRVYMYKYVYTNQWPLYKLISYRILTIFCIVAFVLKIESLCHSPQILIESYSRERRPNTCVIEHISTSTGTMDRTKISLFVYRDTNNMNTCIHIPHMLPLQHTARIRSRHNSFESPCILSSTRIRGLSYENASVLLSR